MKCSCTKTFIALMACSWIVMSCGKKVLNSKPSNGTEYNDTRALQPNSITVDMELIDDGAKESDSFYFTDNAWIVIPSPEALRIKSGKPMHHRTRIYFNSDVDNNFAQNEEIYCEYSVVKNTGDEEYDSTFIGCYQDVYNTGNYEELSLEPGREVHQSSGTYLHFEFVSGFSREPSVIYSELEVSDWY